jgi:hypothetical protein
MGSWHEITPRWCFCPACYDAGHVYFGDFHRNPERTARIIFAPLQFHMPARSRGTKIYPAPLKAGPASGGDGTRGEKTMKTMFLAAITAIVLGLGASTIASAATNDSPWAHYVSQDNGQG